MQKNTSTELHYNTLILSTVRKKLFSFLLGTIVLLTTLILIGRYSFPNLKSQFAGIFSNSTNNRDETPTPTKKVSTYVVKQGDQLFLIAEKIYGSGLNMQDIMVANKLTNPDSIEVGQTLIIPDVKPRFPTTGTITETAASTSKLSEKSDRYVVRPGDDLAKIALQAYGDSYAWIRIAEANNLLNPDDIKVGMILIIPR